VSVALAKVAKRPPRIERVKGENSCG